MERNRMEVGISCFVVEDNFLPFRIFPRTFSWPPRYFFLQEIRFLSGLKVESEAFWRNTTSTLKCFDLFCKFTFKKISLRLSVISRENFPLFFFLWDFSATCWSFHSSFDVNKSFPRAFASHNLSKFWAYQENIPDKMRGWKWIESVKRRTSER